MVINGFSMLVGMFLAYAIYCIFRVWQCEVIPGIIIGVRKMHRRFYNRIYKKQTKTGENSSSY